MVTKGYGFTVEDIDWSCPADLEPYSKSYKLKIQEKDMLNWIQGQYFALALDATVCNSWLWRKKGAKSHTYIEKPILQTTKEKQSKKTREPLSEEEKKKQTEQLFTQLRIMGANFNLNHNK